MTSKYTSSKDGQNATDSIGVDLNHLKMLGELFVEIRAIAANAHIGMLLPKIACQRIYELADAAHNLPDELSELGLGFERGKRRVDSSLARISIARARFAER